MQLFLHSSKLLISIGLTLCISLSSCGGGGGSTGTGNSSTISSVSIGQENALSSAASVAASSINSQLSSSSKPEGNTEISSSSSPSNSQTVSSMASSVANSITDTSVHSSSKDNSSVSTSNSAISSISLISSSSSNSKPSVVSSSTASTLSLSSSSSSVTSVALSSSSSSVIRSSSKAATSSAYSSSLTQISSSSIASSSSTLSSSSLSPTGTAFHLRGTHNAWVEGDLFTPVVGSTTDLEICREFLQAATGASFKVDPNGSWAGDDFPASSVVASGWTKILINGATRTIQSVTKDLAPNCGNDSSFSSSSTQASNSSVTSSSAESFSFPSITDAPLNTDITSKPVTISGLRGQATISIEGGEYAIDNDYFSSQPREIYNGQKVTVKVKTAATTNTPRQASLMITNRGDITATFTVTTMLDITPDNFSFSPVFGSLLATENTSNSITVAGIDGMATVNVSGDIAIFYINDTPYFNKPGVVTNGQRVKVRLRSATTVNTTTSAILTIGSVSRTFAVTTVSESSAPEAKIMFPSEKSLTDGDKILVRGKSNDENNIVSVKINGTEVTTNDNYANWQLSVPLDSGTNKLTIATKDSLNNYSGNAATIYVTRRKTNEYPTPSNAINPFAGPFGIALDSTHNRLLVGDSKSTDITIFSVDLLSGARKSFDVKNSWRGGTTDIAIDLAHNRALTVDESMGNIIAIDLTNGTTKVFSDDNIPNSTLPFSIPAGIAIDASRNRAIVSDYGLKALIAVDLTTGERTVLSSNTSPNISVRFHKPFGITIDERNNRALVVDTDTADIIAVDLTTGVRTIISKNNSPDTTVIPYEPYSIQLDETRNRVLFWGRSVGTLYAMDLTSGATTLLGRWDGPNQLVGGYGITVDSINERAYVASYWLKAIVTIDLVTGEQVIFSQ